MTRSTLSAFVLLSVLLGCQKSGEDVDTKASPDAKASPAAHDKPDSMIQIRQYQEDGEPSDRGDVILIRTDVERLRAYDLCTDDVMKGLSGACSILTTKRIDPPPGVVFETTLYPPKRYEEIIVKVSADGEIVRIKDVAKVELRKAPDQPNADR